jgi:thioesterase domain-containing protein
LVAHAFACGLRLAGETVALLALLDTAAPQTGGTAPDDRTVMAELANVLALAGSGTTPETPIESLAELTQIARDSGMFPSDFSAAQTERLLALYGMTVRLPLDHRPARFDGNVQLFAAEGSDPERLAQSWAPFVAGSIATNPIACRHERMTAPESAQQIAAALADLIRSEIPQASEQLFAAK